mmetsp:Transcript_26413/g.53064  ORF Transcript_26413/g.53064 Transcript_26413/m.53064 type:complete len:355 (-) Transcript_26413:70-1134(-)
MAHAPCGPMHHELSAESLLKGSPTTALELLFELRARVEEIRDQPIVGHLEDGRLGVLVDGDNCLGVLHAGKVLDGARDANSNVEIGSDHLARLANLHVVRAHARIDGRPRSADGSIELKGKGVEHPKVVACFEAAAAGHNDLGGCELGTIRLLNLVGDPLSLADCAADTHLLYLRRATSARRLVEDGRAYCEDLYRVRGLDGSDGIARIHRTDKGLLVLHLQHLGELCHVQQSGNPRERALAERRRCRGNVSVAASCLRRHDHGCPLLRKTLGERRALHVGHRADAGHARSAFRDRLGPLTAHKQLNGPKCLRRRDGCKRCLAERRPIVLADHQRRESAPRLRRTAQCGPTDAA